MPKKKTTPPQTEPKKPQVLALKKNTPALDAQEKIEAPITPEVEVKVPDAQPLTESLTPTLEAEVKTDPQPSAETLTPALETEVKTDAPAPTPGTKSVRPVLKKKSDSEALLRSADRVGDGETSSLAPSTPELLEAPPDGAIFQAVGVIVGEVTFDAEGKATVVIGEKVFPLFYASQKKKAYEALRMELKATGVARQRLMVYPRVTHFPKREEPHRIAFQLVGFFRNERDVNPEEIRSELGDFEFKLSGLWQFIPVCQTPCVSVFKNYTTERKDFIKEADVAVKVNFMKASHAPLMWKDAPVKPFRFNPKLDKEHQGHAAFVQLKVRFDPDKDVFHFLELTAPPASNPPRFLKAGKKDRLQVASDKLKAAKGLKRDKSGEGAKVKPQVVKK
jgi:hypothetical protein